MSINIDEVCQGHLQLRAGLVSVLHQNEERCLDIFLDIVEERGKQLWTKYLEWSNEMQVDSFLMFVVQVVVSKMMQRMFPDGCMMKMGEQLQHLISVFGTEGGEDLQGDIFHKVYFGDEMPLEVKVRTLCRPCGKTQCHHNPAGQVNEPPIARPNRFIV